MIFVVGAKLNGLTRELAEEALHAEVIEAYGTTETGWLAMSGGTSSGELLRGVDVEVVDQHDQLVPYGATGQIRARSPEMGLGYLDQTLSKAAFRDGWYYTGDFGRMQDARHIELIGREDALMNFGGIKISPDSIEETLMARALAQDVAAFIAPQPPGYRATGGRLRGTAAGGTALEQELRCALGVNLGVIKVVVVKQMPRNAAGKLLRGEVRAMIDSLHAGLP